MSESALSVLILAGGEATRLPNKLALDAGAVPMIARVYRNVSQHHPTYVSCHATFPAAIDALLPCPMVIDRWSRRGPLSGLLSTMNEIHTPYVFAVAGDAPFVESAFIDRLFAALEPGDEAVVPTHDRRMEPLAAIYERKAFMRAGLPVLLEGDGALHLVIEKLRARFVPIDDPRIFTNVNTPADYDAVREVLP